MAFKLTKSNVRPTSAELKLVHPVGGETDAVIYLVGTLSKQFKDAQAAVIEQLGPDVDPSTMKTDEQVKLFSPIYASCVTGWNDELTEAIGPFDPEVALTLFTDPDIDWIGAQVAVFVTKTANFFRTGSA